MRPVWPPRAKLTARPKTVGQGARRKRLENKPWIALVWVINGEVPMARQRAGEHRRHERKYASAKAWSKRPHQLGAASVSAQRVASRITSQPHVPFHQLHISFVIRIERYEEWRVQRLLDDRPGIGRSQQPTSTCPPQIRERCDAHHESLITTLPTCFPADKYSNAWGAWSKVKTLSMIGCKFTFFSSR
jgi:hypothetical protein